MKDITTLIALLCLLGMIYGLFKFTFQKGQRKCGLKILSGALVCFLVVAINAPHDTTTSPQSELAREIQNQSKEEQTAKQAKIEPDVRITKDVRQKQDPKLDVSQNTLPNGMNEAEAINFFCDWGDNSWKATLEANEKFGENPKGKKSQAKFDWESERQAGLENQLSQQFSMKYWEVLEMSEQRYWQFHCRAREEGLQVITLAMAKAISDEDAKEALEGLQAFYLFRLNSNSSGFFHKDRFNSARCTYRRIERLPVVGCRLEALGVKSKYDYFVVAGAKNKKLYAAGWIGKGRTHLADAKLLSAYDQPKVHVSRFAYVSDLTREKLDQVFGTSQ